MTHARFRVVRVEWDLDDSDGLWWETGDLPDRVDAELQAVETTYPRAGTWRATLRLHDSEGAHATGSAEVVVP